MCAGVWSSCFSLNVSCLESNLGLSAPELTPNSSFLLPKTVSELWIALTGRNILGLPSFSSFSPSSTNLHFYSVIKKVPFDLEINFQINSGTWERAGPCASMSREWFGGTSCRSIPNSVTSLNPSNPKCNRVFFFVGLNSFIER